MTENSGKIFHFHLVVYVDFRSSRQFLIWSGLGPEVAGWEWVYWMVNISAHFRRTRRNMFAFFSFFLFEQIQKMLCPVKAKNYDFRIGFWIEYWFVSYDFTTYVHLITKSKKGKRLIQNYFHLFSPFTWIQINSTKGYNWTG